MTVRALATAPPSMAAPAGFSRPARLNHQHLPTLAHQAPAQAAGLLSIRESRHGLVDNVLSGCPGHRAHPDRGHAGLYRAGAVPAHFRQAHPGQAQCIRSGGDGGSGLDAVGHPAAGIHCPGRGRHRPGAADHSAVSRHVFFGSLPAFCRAGAQRAGTAGQGWALLRRQHAARTRYPGGGTEHGARQWGNGIGDVEAMVLESDGSISIRLRSAA